LPNELFNIPVKFERSSPSIPSWNQILVFLQQMARLRETEGFAA